MTLHAKGEINLIEERRWKRLASTKRPRTAILFK